MAEQNVSLDGQLGTIVSWKVPNEIGLDELRLALTDAGLDAGLAADMAPRHALTRAMRGLSKNRVIRKLKISSGNLTFQMNRVQVAGGGHIDYPHETDVTLDLTTQVVSCPDPVIERAATDLLNEHIGKRQTGDLTRLIQKIFDSRAADLIPIREQGGAYFVPDRSVDLVDSMRTLLNKIGGNLRSFDIRLGSADTSASVAESMVE